MSEHANTIPRRRSRLVAFIPHALTILLIVILVDTLQPGFRAGGYTNAVVAKVAADVSKIHVAVQSQSLANPGPLPEPVVARAHSLSRLTGRIPVGSMRVLPPGSTRVTPYSHEPLIVVNTVAYADSPRRAFWNLWLARPKHTIGFADGSTALISEEQFAELDLSGFVPLCDWLSGL